MITPVRNISFNKIKTNKQKEQKNSNNQTNPINTINSNTFLPNFTGYLGNRPKVSFEYGVESNLFKLPKVTTQSGKTVQVQPDKCQLECAKKICEGKNVAFFAPTGIGKTAVAHFAMGKNLIEHKRTIYTVPIKALADDKYREFSKIYGKKNVGILTGDRKINGNAPITIMTTEIFDNLIQGMPLNDTLKIGTVVYDEAHYIADEERGMAWENSMINAAKSGIQLLALTATIGNSEDFTRWLGKIPKARPAQMVEVPPSERPVPLVFHLFKRGGEQGPRLVDIMTGEIELKELKDATYDVVDFIFEAEKEYYDRKHEENKDNPDYNNEFLIDCNYKYTILPKLKETFGEDWIKTNFGDKDMAEKLKELFASLDNLGVERINAIASKSGIRALSSNQKRALEIIFNAEFKKERDYKMTDEDYEFTYQQLRMGIGDGQRNFKFETPAFKKRLAREFKKLNSNKVELVSQLLSNPNIKNPKFIHENWVTDELTDVVQTLEKEDMLPAIVFKLSQSGCSQAALSVVDYELDTINIGEEDESEISEEALQKLEEEAQKTNLLTPEEKEQVQEIIDKYKAQGIYLGSHLQESMLLKGWGVHHAGKLPQYKKLIEELFNKKLIKVCVATSTLGAGINMPARTVVFTNTAYKKYNPETKEWEFTPISANDFWQMAGRGGRRGIDEIGHVVFANLHTPTNSFRKEGEKDKKGKIDELFHGYNLLKSDPDPIRSQFRAQPVMLAKYFETNHDTNGLRDIIKDSLKLHLAKDPQKVEKQMLKKFDNFAQTLFKLGFVSKNHKKELALTPKGEILTQCQGMNPLLLATLLYDEKFAKLDACQLAQAIGQIQGSSMEEETVDLHFLIRDSLKMGQALYSDKINPFGFNSTSDKIYNCELKVLKALYEGNANCHEIKKASLFNGYVSYMFATLNQEDSDSIGNFEKIVSSTHLAHSSNKEANLDFARKLTEGNVYKTITGTITILKQIVNICDFAIPQEEKYPNTYYWIHLKETAQEAIELLDKEPINNDPNYENKFSNN